MSIKRITALAGMLLILMAGVAVAQEKKQAEEANQVQVKAQAQSQVKTQTQAQSRTRLRTRFVDQNGDGINDLYRDHDNDGVPNCQDPDWTAPQDGTGYKGGRGTGQADASVQAGSVTQTSANSGFSNRSFRKGQTATGLCCSGCDGTGPKGQALRKGRG